MKKIFIVANWKSNNVESIKWIQQVQSSEKEVIVCPPFTVLFDLKSLIFNHKSSIKLGAQDISPFTMGSYTGEINGEQIKEFAEYVIIGHSERRKYFGESGEMINQKIEQAVNNSLIPIVCVSELDQSVKIKDQIQSLKLKNPEQKIIIAYEPLSAVGSGNPDTPENANEMASLVKKELGDVFVLYGGSVNSENVNSFTTMEYIDGVLVGKSSLNSSEFLKIIQNA